MVPDQACIEIAGAGFGCNRTIKMVGTSDFPEIYPCKLPSRILQRCKPPPPASVLSQGKCVSKALYSIDTEDVPDQCSCCSPTRTEPMQVPLRCTNGSLVYHEILNAMQCRCSPRKCSK